VTPSNRPVVFLCGPRAGGNSDTAGLAFAEGLRQVGADPLLVRLREHEVTPCLGCGACAKGPAHRCPLAGDEAEALFAHLAAASLVAFASPVYFYHLPARFKALIDRAQRHYELRLAREAAGEVQPERPAQALLVAGRKEGQQLFTGSLLTLRYFLWPFSLKLTEPCLLRGLDAPGDLAADAAAVAAIVARGKTAGEAK
jgi:multimeric flavodoxin WrbA